MKKEDGKKESDLGTTEKIESPASSSGNVGGIGDILDDVCVMSSGDATRAVHQFYRAQAARRYGT